jgi:RNA polymerase sigma factor (sigma-70 family)
MGSATPLKTEIIERKATLESREVSVTEDDRTTYDELIAPLESRMTRSIWRVVRDPDLAEDCLQDALAVIWKKRVAIRQHPNPPALILKICLDRAYDSLRRLQKLRHQTNLFQLRDRAVPPDPAGDRNFETEELEQAVQRAIRRLPRKRALAVMMRLIYDEPFEMIAQALGCSEVTARIHISRGRAQLRKWLSPFLQVRRRSENE